jgi:hypothetical protein
MELTNEQKNYVITFETAVQRLVMNMPNIHMSARMDVVRYITEWLLRRPQFFTSHTPLHLARAVTRTRAIDYIRQQARQSAERTWNDIDKCFVGNVALDEMMVQISASDASSYEEALNPESIFFTKMSREIIDQALIKHLTKKQYDVFTLRAFEEFNVNEIAALTRSKHYNVSRLYTQAQKRLRKVYVANPEELGL